MNLVALEQVLAQTPADYAQAPTDVYYELVRQAKRLQEFAKTVDKFVQRTGELRYRERAQTALRDSGRDFGTARLTDGPLQVKFEIPKRVQWDQKRLAEIARRIVAGGEAVESYLDVKLSVPEGRYTNWPPALQEQFCAARTATPGTPSIEITNEMEAA